MTYFKPKNLGDVRLLLGGIDDNVPVTLTSKNVTLTATTIALPALIALPLVVGGPRFDPAMAGDLGVDKIFGRGTTPREVASYLVHVLAPEPVPAGAA